MDSDNSSSDSDSLSDSELESISATFVSSVTAKLRKSSEGRRRKGNTSKEKSRDPKLSNNHKPDRIHTEHAEMADTECENIGFILDKKSSYSRTSETKYEAKETDDFDLSNMNQTISNHETSDIEERIGESEDDDASTPLNVANINMNEKVFDLSGLNHNQEIAVEKYHSKKKRRQQKGKNKKPKSGQFSSSLQTEDKAAVYFNVDPDSRPFRQNLHHEHLKVHTQRPSKELEVMKKCVIPDDVERMTIISTTQESLRKLKKERRIEKEKTKGGKWFDLPATEMSDKYKKDLEILKMRNALDPKRFYKSDDRVGLPKYFQFGRIVETAADFYHSRVPKKQRKATIVEELLADAEFRKFNKRKYAEVQDIKRQRQGPYNRLKRIKKQKKP